MTDQTTAVTEVEPHVQFASRIVDLVGEEDTFSTVLNGIAVAAAAFLVDYVAPRDGAEVDEFSLLVAANKFKEQLDQAAKFAAAQLNAVRQAEAAPEPSRIVLS